MTPPDRFKILFEPVRIGPVTAPNRFYQVPHCTGLGWVRPRMLAELRGVKAEGGWGVVCTEYCSIHPSSDNMPFPYSSLWDDGDIRANALMTDKVHAHGALAGVELWADGGRGAGNFNREASLSTMNIPSGGRFSAFPAQSRAMDRQDIRNLRRWHRDAAVRAKCAGFDIVYVYATHGYLLSQFLNGHSNSRIDEYGGSLENRCRIVRELIEETKEAVGDTCAVAVRYSVDDGGGADGIPVHNEQKDMFEMMAELPDLWDITIDDYSLEMGVSRFVKEGALEPYMSFVKSVTSKPVVSVGRFTSPDTMVSQVRRGIVDFIGAARPSIADPFLPNKIRHDQTDQIRECIGCNICYASDDLSVPIRCTQNPTMGEEWRRGWHPERIKAGYSERTILIVGAGPCGLEAARIAGERGYQVYLADADKELGGRITREAALPGLNEWIRVRDYRVNQLMAMGNVEIYPDNRLRAADVIDLDADHVAIATGASWRTDGFSRQAERRCDFLLDSEKVISPDRAIDHDLPPGAVLIYDDDHYYVATVLAEKLAMEGRTVHYVTPAEAVAVWSSHTSEQSRVVERLVALGVSLLTTHFLSGFNQGEAILTHLLTGAESHLIVDLLVPVTAREPNDGLYYDLIDRPDHSCEGLGFSLTRIGDCDAPMIIADAVFAGHRWARELDEVADESIPIRYDRVFNGEFA